MKRRIRIAVVVREDGEPDCWPIRDYYCTDEQAFTICGAKGARFIVEADIEVPDVQVVEGRAAPVEEVKS